LLGIGEERRRSGLVSLENTPQLESDRLEARRENGAFRFVQDS